MNKCIQEKGNKMYWMLIQLFIIEETPVVKGFEWCNKTIEKQQYNTTNSQLAQLFSTLPGI